MKPLFRNSIFGLLMSLLSVVILVAQGANCPNLIEEALQAVDESCANTGRNEACYAYDQVEASFLSTVADDFFTQPADIAEIAEIKTIRTVPLNAETGVWGVAIINMQANLPNTLPGQVVTFVLLGDVEIENAVAPEDAFVPGEGIEVEIATSAGANVRSGPGTNTNVVGALDDGETVLADALSEDGQWLRVAYRERPAWLSMTVINDDNPALSDLPTLSADLHTPMQAFYLRTGIGQPECEDVPRDALLVQGPENIEITITVNGVNIQLGSSGALTVIEQEGKPFLEINVFDGEFAVDDETIRRGQRSIVCLGDEASRGLDGEANDLVQSCDPSNPEPMDREAWCNLENIPESLLNYPLDVPCPGETETTASTGVDSQIAEVDCSRFSILSQTIVATDFIFSWTEAPGADSYEIAVYDNAGTQISSTFASGTSLNMNGGTAFPSSGYVDLRAYRAGAYACYTRLNFTRVADPNAPAPETTQSP
jgi:hypothetical protein